MARTSENGETEGGPTTAAASDEKWLTRDGIKQEIIIDLDQSSSSIGEKDWSFLPAAPTSEIINANDLFQDSVLFGSNINDPVNKEKIEKVLDNATSTAQRKTVANVLHEIEKLSDMERLLLYFKLPLGRSSDVDPLRMPLNPLGSRPEIMQTVVWIQTHLEEDVEVSLPKQEVYEEYGAYCTENCIKPLSTADFGKVMKQVFPNVRPRRLGTRGHSRYCYSGLRKKGELSPPTLSDLFCDNGNIGKTVDHSSNGTRSTTVTPDLLNERACTLIREWAEKLLGLNFSGMGDLANYLVDKLYVDQRGKATLQWNKIRPSHNSEEETHFHESKHEVGCGEHDNMRELKRKLQEQHSQATRRQSVQNRHSKKTKVMSIPGSSPQHQVDHQPAGIQQEEKDNKPLNKKNRNKRKSKEDARRSSASSLVETTTGHNISTTGLNSSASGATKLAGKMPIPRLTSNRSPRPPSTILLLPTQSQSPSPTTSVNKTKFIPIQPKPQGNCNSTSNSNSNSNGSENGLIMATLPQLKEEEGIFGPSMDPLDAHWVEGTSQDDEIAYLTQPGEPLDSHSPKAKNSQLSQLRVLLQQNEDKKKGTTVGLLERRNVRFETPTALSDQNNPSDLSSNSGNGVVPPSPNTRRRAFNFTPISPRLTPDVIPASPGASGAGQLRQLLSTTSSGVNSPFVSPRQTPVPQNPPPSQPHSRHNSGHTVVTETPSSIITEASSVSNDSAFVSPLNTPISVSRSRHNSASNLLVNRVRHSSGANITVRHMPYTTTGILANHGMDGLLNPSVRSRHSSAGSTSLPRSAPLSPLVQSFTQIQQQQNTSELGNERIRQDLRRRHVSAGVVGMNRNHITHLPNRAQTTLNSAAPLWGSDPLAQEIEGLLDSASSNVNDSVRSQSVPLHQMLNQLQFQGGQNQVYSSLSQPSTPFGSGKPFSFNASAASSPYSYTATPIPTEWNDFSSHVNSIDSAAETFGQLDTVGQELEGFQEIISEVYAKNQQELAPCLEGLDSEPLQQPASSLSHLTFPGTTTGMSNMDSDPSLSCSDTGDGFPLSDLNDQVTLPSLLGAEELAATLVALKEAPELSRIVQDVVDGQHQTVAVPQGM